MPTHYTDWIVNDTLGIRSVSALSTPSSVAHKGFDFNGIPVEELSTLTEGDVGSSFFVGSPSAFIDSGGFNVFDWSGVYLPLDARAEVVEEYGHLTFTMNQLPTTPPIGEWPAGAVSIEFEGPVTYSSFEARFFSRYMAGVPGTAENFDVYVGNWIDPEPDDILPPSIFYYRDEITSGGSIDVGGGRFLSYEWTLIGQITTASGVTESSFVNSDFPLSTDHAKTSESGGLGFHEWQVMCVPHRVIVGGELPFGEFKRIMQFGTSRVSAVTHQPRHRFLIFEAVDAINERYALRQRQIDVGASAIRQRGIASDHIAQRQNKWR